MVARFQMDQPRPLFVNFPSFQKTLLQFLQQMNVKKYYVHPVFGAGIQTHNLSNMSRLP